MLRAGLEIDWSDPDTLVGVAGAVLGLAVGIGAPPACLTGQFGLPYTVRVWASCTAAVLYHIFALLCSICSVQPDAAPSAGAPLFYISRDERDEQRLEELRQLNRQTFKETGEYLSEVRSGRDPLSVALLACAARVSWMACCCLALPCSCKSRLLTLVSSGSLPKTASLDVAPSCLTRGLLFVVLYSEKTLELAENRICKLAVQLQA